MSDTWSAIESHRCNIHRRSAPRSSGKVKSRSSQGQVKVKSRSSQGQVKIKSRSSQDQVKIKSRSRSRSSQGQAKVKSRSGQNRTAYISIVFHGRCLSTHLQHQTIVISLISHSCLFDLLQWPMTSLTPSEGRCNKTYTQLRQCTIEGAGLHTKIKIKALRVTIQPLGSPADTLSEYLSREYQWSTFRTIPGVREWLGENWRTIEEAYGANPPRRRTKLPAIDEQYGTQPPAYQPVAPAIDEQNGKQLPAYQSVIPPHRLPLSEIKEQYGRQPRGHRLPLPEIKEQYGRQPRGHRLWLPEIKEQYGRQPRGHRLWLPEIEEQYGTQPRENRSRFSVIEETFRLPEETDITQRCHSQQCTESESTLNPLGVYFCVSLGAYLGTYFDAWFGR
jgi:hypothetical protein